MQIDWGAIDFGTDSDKAADTIDFGDLVNTLSFYEEKTYIHDNFFIDKLLTKNSASRLYESFLLVKIYIRFVMYIRAFVMDIFAWT